jgi:glycosyltransferase involved in cell wall biosynthesis
VNILFIHEIDWLKKVVFEPHTLSELLSLFGHQVYVIDYESMWKKDRLLDFGHLRTEVIDNVSRVYPNAKVSLRRPGFIKIPGLSRFSAIFTQYREIRRTIREKKIDVIVLYAVATNGLQTLQLARKTHIPVVFRSIDILHRLVPHSFLRPIVKCFEKKIYSEVDLLLPHTPKEIEYVISMGAQKTKVKLLPYPLEIDRFRPSPGSTELRRKWGFGKNDKIIFFQGTLYDFSGLDIFLREFPALLEQVPAAKLLLVGDGPQRPLLESLVTQLNLEDRVVITGFQPFTTIPEYTNLAEVCINPFAVNDITRNIFPAKIPQYLACAKPVVSTTLPGLMSVIPGEDKGIIYVDSVQTMVTEVISLLKSKERRQKLGKAGLNYVYKTHDAERVGRQLEMILKEVITKKKND